MRDRFIGKTNRWPLSGSRVQRCDWKSRERTATVRMGGIGRRMGGASARESRGVVRTDRHERRTRPLEPPAPGDRLASAGVVSAAPATAAKARARRAAAQASPRRHLARARRHSGDRLQLSLRAHGPREPAGRRDRPLRGGDHRGRRRARARPPRRPLLHRFPRERRRGQIPDRYRREPGGAEPRRRRAHRLRSLRAELLSAPAHRRRHRARRAGRHPLARARRAFA